ncbi:hypothetical protein ACFPM7_06625 [Actinokineospora guangxiensis]|uniref:IPT/TIG domain-containing protein n=1 Tax=Actinokineospora guangxiensis TaxID=1490288 RepID=A0ABW0EKD2_9PSEU
MAPVGAELTVSGGTEGVPDRLRGLTVGRGEGVTISLSSGQPARPLEVTLPLAGPAPEGTVPVVLTQPSDGGEPHLIPGRHDPAAGTITAAVDHLSGFWPGFLDLEAFGRDVMRAVTEATGITTARPDCAGQPAEAPGGGKITADKDFSPTANPPLWACLKADAQGLEVDLTSNSPLPWRTRAKPNAVLAPQGSLDATAGFLLAAYNTLATERPYAEGLLTPGGTANYRFPRGALPATIAAKVDVGTWLAMDLLFAITTAAALFKVDLGGLADSAEVVSCLGDAVEAAGITTVDGSAIAAMAKAVLSCVEPFVKAMGGVLTGLAVMVLAVLAEGAALVFGGLQGIYLSLTGQDTFTVTVTSDRPTTTTANPADYRFVAAGDWERYYFSSPSGRFICGILGSVADEPPSAGCHGETDPIPPRPADCSEHISWGGGLFVDATGNTDFICTGGVIYDSGFGDPGRPLPYGASLTALGFTCTSAQTGISCTHTDTRHGFRIATTSNERF